MNKWYSWVEAMTLLYAGPTLTLILLKSIYKGFAVDFMVSFSSNGSKMLNLLEL